MTSAPTRAASVVQYRTSASGVADAQLSRDARVLGCLRLCQGADGYRCRRQRYRPTFRLSSGESLSPTRFPSLGIRGDGRGGVKVAPVRVAAGWGRCRCAVAVRAAVRARGWEIERGQSVTPADFGIRTRFQA